MSNPLASLIAAGTKLWLDSIDPELVKRNRALGATGATSNPIIIADLIKTGRFDDALARLMRDGLNDADIAWQLTDMLVRQAQQVFEPVWKKLQVGLRLLCQPRRCLSRKACAATGAGGPGPGRHRQRQEDRANEPPLLGRQEAGAAPGDDLRQHRHQKALRSSLEICRSL